MPDSVTFGFNGTIEEIFRGRRSELELALVKTPIQIERGNAVIDECDFPGYRRTRGQFRAPAESTPDDGATLSCESLFTRRVAGPPQSVAGCFVVWQPDENSVYELYAENFQRPSILEAVGDSCKISVDLRGVSSAVDSSRLGYVVGISRVISWKGGATMYPLAGQDRALVRTTLGGLVALMQRDTALNELSEGSTRSRVPLVPQEDAELAAAVTLVKTRLELLLTAVN